MSAFGMRRSSTQRNSIRGVYNLQENNSSNKMKLSPLFKMKVDPSDWKRRDYPVKKPMVWVSDLRRTLLQTISLAVAAGQHVLLDVMVDDSANIDDETEQDDKKYDSDSDEEDDDPSYVNKKDAKSDSSDEERQKKSNKNRSKRKKKKSKDEKKKSKKKKSKDDDDERGGRSGGPNNNINNYNTRRKKEEKSPGKAIEGAVKDHMKDLRVSRIRLKKNTPVEDIYIRRSARSGQLRDGPIYSDIVIIEDLHKASYEMLKFINDIMSFRRAPKAGDIFKMPLEHRFTIVVVCSHKKSSKNSTMLLPLNIREGFFLSMRLDVPLIARQQSGTTSVKINENTTINEDNNNKNIMGSINDTTRLSNTSDLLNNLLDIDELNNSTDEEEENDKKKSRNIKKDDLQKDNNAAGEKNSNDLYYETLCKFLLLDFNNDYEQNKFGSGDRRRNRRMRQQNNQNGIFSAIHEDAEQIESAASDLYVANSLSLYLINIQIALRSHNRISTGPTGRKISISQKQSYIRKGNNLNCLIDPFLEAARLTAFLHGSEYLLPWHIRYITPFVFSHRFDLQRDQFIGGRRGSGNMTDLYADAERICLEVLNSIPCILSDVNMFFPKHNAQIKRGYSNSIGTPGNSNTNTPVMLNKKVSRDIIDNNNKNLSTNNSMMKVASKIIDHRRQRTLSSSDTQVENVSNNENALDRHLFDDNNKINESDDLNNTTDVHKDDGINNSNDKSTTSIIDDDNNNIINSNDVDDDSNNEQILNQSSDYDFTLDFENNQQ